jgi:hypothetical protein
MRPNPAKTRPINEQLFHNIHRTHPSLSSGRAEDAHCFQATSSEFATPPANQAFTPIQLQKRTNPTVSDGV